MRAKYPQGAMTAPARNLVNLKDVAKGYAARSVLTAVTLGVSEGDRIGIVGRNGDGKSTLLKLIAGSEEPDTGAVTRVGGLQLSLLGQGDDLDDDEDRPRGARRRPRRSRVGRGRALPQRARGPARRGRDAPLPEGPRHRRRPALGRRTTPDRARQDPARPPAAAAARRAHQPPRRRGRRLARPPPRRPPRRDARHHPRSLVPRRRLHPHLGGRRRRGPPVRGRLRGLRARPRRARAPVRGARRAPPAAAAQGARVAAQRPARAHEQAQVPHRGRQRPDRRRARPARHDRAAEVRELAPGHEGDRRRARQPRLRRQDDPRTTSAGSSAPATGSRWSASTAPASRP